MMDLWYYWMGLHCISAGRGYLQSTCKVSSSTGVLTTICYSIVPNHLTFSMLMAAEKVQGLSSVFFDMYLTVNNGQYPAILDHSFSSIYLGFLCMACVFCHWIYHEVSLVISYLSPLIVLQPFIPDQYWYYTCRFIIIILHFYIPTIIWEQRPPAVRDTEAQRKGLKVLYDSHYLKGGSLLSAWKTKKPLPRSDRPRIPISIVTKQELGTASCLPSSTESDAWRQWYDWTG